MLGRLAYYFDLRHKALVYANLKVAFARTKGPQEIRKITKTFFQNYGQNFIELFRLSSLTPRQLEQAVTIEGTEHLDAALSARKGAILLVMHFGNWELANRSSAMLGYPYKVIVKQQKKFFRLNELLNSYRRLGGSVVISRGTGTRELIKSLENNEVIGMVADQGGKDGVLVPFLGRQASLSVGAIRLALKRGVPLCFSVIIRENHARHRVIIHKPLELETTGELEKDIVTNLTKLAKMMEQYITQYPAEYMWSYKIWKYSKQATIAVLNDGKKGHLNQSLALAQMIDTALSERGVQSETKVLDVVFQRPFGKRWVLMASCAVPAFFLQGRLEFLSRFLTRESFEQLMAVKADFLVSCGSSLAPFNYLLSRDNRAKSICVLKPSVLSFKRFDLVVLPQHDAPLSVKPSEHFAITRGAPNLITPEYLKRHSELLLKRFSHLKSNFKIRIGLLIGGDNKNYCLTEDLAKIVIDQIEEIAAGIGAEILATTSRRTPPRVENFLMRELKKYPPCSLLIIANRQEIPEAVGGILALSDILVVSGDSISMISEAAASGKNTVVFSMKKRKGFFLGPLKHDLFMERLNDEGFIVTCDPPQVGRLIYDVAKNKIKTKTLDDRSALLKAVREIL